MTSVNKELEQLGFSYVVGQGVKWYNHFGKQFSSLSYKVKHTLTAQLSDFTPRYLPKRNENICPYKDLCVNVHENFIHNSLNQRQFKCPSTSEEIDLQIVMHL